MRRVIIREVVAHRLHIIQVKGVITACDCGWHSDLKDNPVASHNYAAALDAYEAHIYEPTDG